jgi:hypothetical protein
MLERLTRLQFGAVLCVVGLSGPASAASPFDDAWAVWHMGAAKDPAGKSGPLAIAGNVKLGVELAGAEREAAVRRGGDGCVAHNVRITLRVVPHPGARCFGLCLRGKGEYESGCELRFDPPRQRAQYGVPHDHGPAKEATGRIALGRDYTIENVERLDRPFTLEIIVTGDLIDTCIDGRRTMITRRDPEPDGGRLFFFARAGQVTFESVEVRPLQDAARPGGTGAPPVLVPALASQWHPNSTPFAALRDVPPSLKDLQVILARRLSSARKSGAAARWLDFRGPLIQTYGIAVGLSPAWTAP